MKAAWFESFGSARDVLKVGQQETPEPAEGEVRVRLAFSAVNPSDVKKRAGSAPGLLDNGTVIPHSDGSGIIDAVGAGVDPARMGERVWVYQAQHARSLGTAAEYVCLESRRAASLPDKATLESGACMGIPAMTAHRCVFADGPVDGQRVLITGGAGRVGHYAIQWASQSGARVIATASNEADRTACLEAGADAVVNHREADWPSQVLKETGQQRMDRVIDLEFGTNLPGTLDVINTSGTLVTYGSAQVPEPVLPFYRMMFMDLVVRLVIVYDMPEAAKQQAIDDIFTALRDNRLTHRIPAQFPLEKIADAHELVETGAVRGAVLVQTGQAS